jgi:hypothetical protein
MLLHLLTLGQLISMISQGDRTDVRPSTRSTPRTPYTVRSLRTLQQSEAPPATITQKQRGAEGGTATLRQPG